MQCFKNSLTSIGRVGTTDNHNFVIIRRTVRILSLPLLVVRRSLLLKPYRAYIPIVLIIDFENEKSGKTIKKLCLNVRKH